SNLEGHKAQKIEEIIIVTFLPEDVVDGLYSAVERAGLSVMNMTLEPIAAIAVAIPKNFRMLNIALVDVGAGTSDICITRDGSICAYGMIPYAGDELTEVIVQAFLVDFDTAEQIKKDSTTKDKVTYSDIMGIEHTVPAKDVWKLTDPVMEKITDAVADKIIELNGDKAVAAAFVVGGGGKVHGFTTHLSEKLGIAHERVALRGEEVMKNITFPDGVNKDPLFVTPIGICLNYYEQKNNFIMIHFNGEIMKLYDNGHLKIIDAAMQSGMDTAELFPKRGKETRFTVNGEERMVRGAEGESATVMMNGHVASLNTVLIPNATVSITGSTAGGDGTIKIENLDEFSKSFVSFIVNGTKVKCPKFVEVNGTLQPGSYVIKNGDAIETRDYYTVSELAKFMDVDVDENHQILVNSNVADMNTLIYENFSIDWTVTGAGNRQNEMSGYPDDSGTEPSESDEDVSGTDETAEDGSGSEASGKVSEASGKVSDDAGKASDDAVKASDDAGKDSAEDASDSVSVNVGSVAASDAKPTNRPERPATPLTKEAVEDMGIPKNVIYVKFNDQDVSLSGRDDYIFADVLAKVDFDVNSATGKSVVITKNGVKCGYADPISDGDELRIDFK
ncbi:MAG: cell division FtsA domain-containing protein, partial [Candidatus Weimeria sp.]